MPPLWAERPVCSMRPVHTGQVSAVPVSGSASTPFPLIGGCLRSGSFCQVNLLRRRASADWTAPAAPAAGSYGRNGGAFLPLVNQKEETRKGENNMKKMPQVKPLTGEDIFWVLVIVFGLPFIVFISGGHIG